MRPSMAEVGRVSQNSARPLTRVWGWGSSPDDFGGNSAKLCPFYRSPNRLPVIRYGSTLPWMLRHGRKRHTDRAQTCLSQALDRRLGRYYPRTRHPVTRSILPDTADQLTVECAAIFHRVQTFYPSLKIRASPVPSGGAFFFRIAIY